MSDNLTINLRAKQDCDGNTYYIGKCQAPVNIDCSKGVAFLIFTAEDGEEQLQIAPMKHSPST